MSKKCNSPAEFPALVVFLGVFFRKFAKKIEKCHSDGSHYCRQDRLRRKHIFEENQDCTWFNFSSDRCRCLEHGILENSNPERILIKKYRVIDNDFTPKLKFFNRNTDKETFSQSWIRKKDILELDFWLFIELFHTCLADENGRIFINNISGV